MKNPYINTSIQEKLYRKHLFPNEQNLIKTIQDVRSDVDAFFIEKQQRSPRIQRSLWIQDIHKYPHWHCYEIACKVKEWLTEIAPEFFKEFLVEGGFFDRNWWIYKRTNWERMFHNTLQIGTRIYDVCNEEPSETDRKTHITHISDPQYRIIDTYEEYTNVREEYHHFTAYRTEWVINIAYACVIPLIFISSDGRLIIWDEQVIIKRNVLTNFQFGKDFLKKWVQKYPQLPENIAKNLLYCFEENIRYTEDEERKLVATLGFQSMTRGRLPFSHKNIKKWIKMWHTADGNYKDHGLDDLYSARLTITLLRRVLNTYNALLLKGKLPYPQENNWQIQGKI